MISARGTTAAAAAMALAAGLGALVIMVMGDADLVGRINAHWLIGAFAMLLSAGLFALYVSARKKQPGAKPVDRAKAVGMQLLRALLLLIGILALFVVIGIGAH